MSSYTVFKYPLDPSKLDDASGMDLMLPRGSRPLYAAVQYSSIMLYAVTDRAQALRGDLGGHEWWRVYVVGTGHQLRFDHEEFDSMEVAILEEGHLMFHVFISKEPMVP